MPDSTNLSSIPRGKAEIARENGAKSHGPVTAEGKTRSSQNSLTHSLTATQMLFLTPEDRERFNGLHQSYADLWHPENVMEEALVHTMVVASWQEQRCLAIETAIFTVQMHALAVGELEKAFDSLDEITRQAIAFMKLADESRALSLLLRYRNAHLRNYDRAMRQLIALRTKGIFREAEKRNEPAAAPNPQITNEQPAPANMVKTAAAASDSEHMPESNPATPEHHKFRRAA